MNFVMLVKDSTMKNILVEWEIILSCNYDCGYCGLLDNTIKPTTDEKKLDTFIKNLHEKYPNIEIFLFGGEPFLHPKIEFIIERFLYYKQPFIIQTNFSNKSVTSIKAIKNIKYNIPINISIHPDQCNINDVITNIENIKNIEIHNLDVMYIGKKSIEYYNKIKDKIGNEFLHLTPVTDIGCTGYAELLKEYNTLKRNKIYNKIINFENIERSIDNVTKQRSFIWEDFNDKKYFTYGKPCLYQNRYFLFDPQLNMYNCCYRKINTGTCINEVCFLM